MPYVYYDELPEGAEAVEAVAKADYDTLAEQRNQLTERAVQAESNLAALQTKYADLLLQTPEPREPARHVEKTITIDDLF